MKRKIVRENPTSRIAWAVGLLAAAGIVVGGVVLYNERSAFAKTTSSGGKSANGGGGGTPYTPRPGESPDPSQQQVHTTTQGGKCPEGYYLSMDGSCIEE